MLCVEHKYQGLASQGLCWPGAEVGKVTLKSNGDEALRDEFLLKSNSDEALNDFP
jgi:hypothetical protein